jgi:hypothetical protein
VCSQAQDAQHLQENIMLTTLSITSLNQGKIAPRYGREPTPVEEAATVEVQKAQWLSKIAAAVIRSIRSGRFGHKATVGISNV